MGKPRPAQESYDILSESLARASRERKGPAPGRYTLDRWHEIANDPNHEDNAAAIDYLTNNYRLRDISDKQWELRDARVAAKIKRIEGKRADLVNVPKNKLAEANRKIQNEERELRVIQSHDPRLLDTYKGKLNTLWAIPPGWELHHGMLPASNVGEIFGHITDRKQLEAIYNELAGLNMHLANANRNLTAVPQRIHQSAIHGRLKGEGIQGRKYFDTDKPTFNQIMEVIRGPLRKDAVRSIQIMQQEQFGLNQIGHPNFDLERTVLGERDSQGNLPQVYNPIEAGITRMASLVGRVPRSNDLWKTAMPKDLENPKNLLAEVGRINTRLLPPAAEPSKVARPRAFSKAITKLDGDTGRTTVIPRTKGKGFGKGLGAPGIMYIADTYKDPHAPTFNPASLGGTISGQDEIFQQRNINTPAGPIGGV